LGLPPERVPQPITSHPGLWELPTHPVVVPPDDRCAAYGVAPGLRARSKDAASGFDQASGKITGFDCLKQILDWVRDPVPLID
jgi:hypothetical protein